MDIFINTDKSPAQLQAKSTGSPLSSFKVKRGAVVPLSVTILGSSSASGLRMGIKAKGNYEGDLLILAEADSGTQTEQGTRFDLKLVASSLALNDALDVGEGKESTPATLAAMTEFAWMECGETRLSDTLQTTIINDIVRLATDAPEAATGEYPAPDLVATKSWVNSKQATADSSGFVMLGTDEPITGKNARPVGKTESGGMAVDDAPSDTRLSTMRRVGFAMKQRASAQPASSSGEPTRSYSNVLRTRTTSIRLRKAPLNATKRHLAG